MPKYYVYQLRAATENSPFYIGKGTGNRKMQHFSHHSLKQRNYKSNKIKHYQSHNIPVLAETLFEFEDETEAYAKETELIKFYGRVNIGTGCLTNLCDGGMGTRNLSPESRERRAKHFRGKKLSPEHIQRAIAGATGKKRDTKAKFNQSCGLLGRTRREDEVNSYSKFTRREAYEHVKAWTLAGVSITEYCAKLGIGQSTFQRCRSDPYVLEYAKREGFELRSISKSKGKILPPKTDKEVVISLIKEWEQSQTSITQFCQSKGLNVGTFRSWRKNPFIQQALEKPAANEVFTE